MLWTFSSITIYFCIHEAWSQSRFRGQHQKMLSGRNSIDSLTFLGCITSYLLGKVSCILCLEKYLSICALQMKSSCVQYAVHADCRMSLCYCSNILRCHLGVSLIYFPWFFTTSARHTEGNQAKLTTIKCIRFTSAVFAVTKHQHGTMPMIQNTAGSTEHTFRGEKR